MGAHFDHVADDYVDHGESVRVRTAHCVDVCRAKRLG